jgi:monothiol glutaredoxin
LPAAANPLLNEYGGDPRKIWNNTHDVNLYPSDANVACEKEDRSESMTRSILDDAHIHPAIREKIAINQADIVREVQAAIAATDVVVVGMAQNLHPKRARRLLDVAGVPYRYLEYGSYFNQWRRRNALKMWTGWPTFPMVFVKGVLIGGASDLGRLIDSGELRKMLVGKPAA